VHHDRRKLRERREGRSPAPTARFQLIFYEREKFCKSPSWLEGSSKKEGLVGLMFDAVYYTTTLVHPLLLHSPSAIYINVRSV